MGIPIESVDIVFVHGALVRDGAWWWAPTAGLLRERAGLRSRAVALPSCGEAGSDVGGLVEDAAALRAALDDCADGAIVVGHSYGGTVIAEAGAHEAVRRLVLITSYLPDAGHSQADIVGAEPEPVRVADAGGGLLRVDGLDEAGFAARFLQDADAATAAEGWARVVPQSAAAFVTSTTAEGWRGVDSTYLVCADDRSTSLALQREHAARATRSIDLPTGHHPFVSRPDLVADVVAALMPDTGA